MTSCVEEAMISYWGNVCQDYDKDCPVCKAWDNYNKPYEEVWWLRELLHDIVIEATYTVPPDGEEAAWAALENIAKMIYERAVP